MDQKLQAQKMFENVVQAFKIIDWTYTKKDDTYTLSYSVKCENANLDFVIFVDTERYLVRLLSRMPFKTPKNKIVDMSIATNIINGVLADGSFDFDLTEGDVFFRITSSYRDSSLSANAVVYMLGCATYTVDEYVSRLAAVAQSMLNAEDILPPKKN